MTATIGVTAQSMTNMINIVNPNGGIIIMSSKGRNAVDYETSVWQVFKDKNGFVKLKLLLMK